jgi:hypothetical protein
LNALLEKLTIFCRKTGVTIPAPGEVDADGFQPLESIFSSPRKAPQSDSDNGDNAGDDEEPEEEEEEGDESGSEDMVIEQSTDKSQPPLHRGLAHG